MAVRNESVRLSLDDAYSTGVVKAAAVTAMLKRELSGLDGTTVAVTKSTDAAAKKTKEYTLEMAVADEKSRRLRASLRDQAKALLDVDTAVGQAVIDLNEVSDSSDRADRSINQLTGRLRLFADIAAILGPSLVPIGAVAVPAVFGLATAAGAAALAGGSMLTAFVGVGDALKAVNEAALEPTAQNLEKARQAMADIGPDAQRFVREFKDFQPVLSDIRDAAARGWFPGLIESLDDFERVGPRVAELFEQIGVAGGQVVADTAEAFASERWAPFLDFLTREMPAALTSLSTIVGDLTHGISEMFMSFDPGNDAFLGWLEGVADGFDRWASSAEGRDDIEGFLAYVEQTGPKVQELFSSLIGALSGIAQAAAPLGGPVLEALTAVAKVVEAIAKSDLGTPLLAAVAGVSALARARSGLDAFRRSLDGIGTSAGIAQTRLASLSNTTLFGAAGLGVNEALGQVDSLGRAWDVLGVKGAESIAQLESTLQQSNIGKYANEFGIDLHRLAEDIYRNGESGEYFQEVVDSLGGEMTGFGNILDKSVRNMFGISSESDHAAQAMQELGQIAGENVGTLGDVASATGDAADETGGFADTLGETAAESDRAARAMDNFATSLAGLTGFLDRRQAFRDYNDSVRELSRSLKDGFTRKDVENLDQVGRNIAQVASTMKDPSLRADFLKNARNSLADLADGQGPKARAEIEKLLNKLDQFSRTKPKPPKLDLDDDPFLNALGMNSRRLRDFGNNKAEPTADLNTSPFEAAFRATKGQIADLDGDRATIQIVTQRITEFFGGNGTGSADGGTVPKTGQHYADRHPYLLADGEEVISNRHGQADRNRPLLKAINAGFLAGGGTAGAGNTSVAGANAWNPHGPANFRGGMTLELVGIMQNLRDLRRSLKLDGKDALKGLDRVAAELELKEALKELRQARAAAASIGDAKEARHLLRDQARAADLQVKMAERRVELAEKALDVAESQRDEIVSAMKSLSDAVGGKGAASLFGDGATVASAIAGAKGNSAMALGLGRAIESLTAKGLSMAALNALLQEGGAQTIIDFAKASASELAAFSGAFGQMQANQSYAGQVGANAVYGNALSAANSQVSAAQAGAARAQQTADKALAAQELTLKQLEKANAKYDRLIEAAATLGPQKIVNAIKGTSGDAARRANK